MRFYSVADGRHQTETAAKNVAQLAAKEAEYVRRIALEERQEAQQRATLLQAKLEVGRERRLCSVRLYLESRTFVGYIEL